jgi:hypothetical protein
MKTKTLLFLCLLLGIGLTKLSAQAPPNMPDGTKSVVWTFTYPWEQDISCGSYQDVLSGIITFHETDLFKNGVMTRGENHGDGILTNSNGDEFVIHINFKGHAPYDANYNYLNWTYHNNIVGENGAIFIGAASMTQDGVFTIEKAVCPDNGKKVK